MQAIMAIHENALDTRRLGIKSPREALEEW